MAKKKNNVVEENENIEEVVDEIPQPNPLEMIEALTIENEKLKNEYFKAYADAENYKKRTQRELDNALKYRIQSFAIEVLPVLDNLERALSSDTSDEGFKTGVQMIYDQLVSALKNEGVTEIEATDVAFDANVHQAIMTEKIEDLEAGQVIAVLQKGYKLKDRVLRAAMVKVSE